jgi:hypothetical protein
LLAAFIASAWVRGSSVVVSSVLTCISPC